jgi:hypothetical protein
VGKAGKPDAGDTTLASGNKNKKSKKKKASVNI